MTRAALLVFLSAALAVNAAGDDCRRAISYPEPIITARIDSAGYGDFDEDGRVDVALMLGSTRIIALNRGDAFQPMPREDMPPSGSLAFLVPINTVSDINGDGHLDLVYVDNGNGMWVALGFGNGVFRPLVHSGFPDISVDQFRAVDFDHDGFLDFVALESGNRGVTFLRSRRDGTFEIAARASLSSLLLQAIGKAVGDFDGDGNLDVVRIGTESSFVNAVESFAWNDGTFHFTETTERVELPHTLQPLDVDGDGAEELVGIDKGSLVIVRMKNRHIAVERVPVAPEGVSQSFIGPVMRDANGDGVRDLVFASGTTIGIIPRTADGHFGAAAYYEMTGTNGFATVDVDGDGVLDLAATKGKQGLPVLYGAPLAAGAPNGNRIYPVGFAVGAVELADVDGDGSRDLIASSDPFTAPLTTVVLFNDGHGMFPRAAKPIVSAPAGVSGRNVIGDFDGDGRADLVFTPSVKTTGLPSLAFGGTDGFGVPALVIDADFVIDRVSLGASSPAGLIALRGDDVQLITVSSGRSVTATTIYHRPAGATVQVVRTPANAPAEITVTNGTDVKRVVRTPTGWSERPLATTTPFGSIASADLNNDGRMDYVVAADSPKVFFDKGDGSFRVDSLIGVGPGSIDSLTPVDVDHDGLPDLVITQRSSFGDPGYVQILRNTPGGTPQFQPYNEVVSGAPFRSRVAVDDVDGDGWIDVVIPTFEGAEVMRNVCAPPRVRVSAVPPVPTENSRVTLVLHALSSNASSVGLLTIYEKGVQLAFAAPYLAYDLATWTWTSTPLSAGTHTYRIVYTDQWGGPSEISVVVTTRPQVPRRRATHH